MGIFINSSLFEFEINFDELLIQDVLVGIKVSNQGKSKLICKAKGRDFDTMSKILEDSTVLNSVNGNAMLRVSNFYKLIIKNFIKEMYLITDDNKEEIIINSDNINSIHYNLVKAISKKWMALTGG
jgi:hypothetical protein